jgi:hypothetical protein
MSGLLTAGTRYSFTSKCPETKLSGMLTVFWNVNP